MGEVRNGVSANASSSGKMTLKARPKAKNSEMKARKKWTKLEPTVTNMWM